MNFANVPDSLQYRCTRCHTVRHTSAFSSTQKKKFKKSYHGNSKAGIDTSQIPLLCKECGQIAHAESTQHYFSCSYCRVTLPADQDYFGNASRKAKAQRHICRACHQNQELEDQYTDEETEEMLVQQGDDFYGLPEDMADSDDDNELMILHDDELKREQMRKKEATHAHNVTLSKTVMTAANKEQIQQTLRRHQIDLDANLKMLKPKFVQELERLKREAQQKAARDQRPHRARGRAVAVEAGDGKDDSDREVEAILSAGGVERYEHAADSVSWRTNPVRKALLPTKASKSRDQTERGTQVEEAECSDEEDGPHETIARWTERFLGSRGQAVFKPRDDGTTPSMKETTDKFAALTIEKAKREGKLPASGSQQRQSRKQREKKWRNAVDPVTASLQLEAEKQGLARTRVQHEPPQPLELDWYKGMETLSIVDDGQGAAGPSGGQSGGDKAVGSAS